MENIRLKSFQQLYAWRAGLMLFAGGLLGVTLVGVPWLAEYIDLGIQNLMLMGLIVLIVAVAYFGSIICHELYEINDQLSGRSPELREWLGARANGNSERP